MEDRRVTVAGIGKYRIVSGLAMSWAGTRYVVLAYFWAPNDQVGASGNPMEMTLVHAPTVPEEPRACNFMCGAFGFSGSRVSI